MDNQMIKKHIISLYVNNKPGVLIRISLVFARRGYNIDSLVVSQSDNPKYSHMTITATGNAKTLDLMLKQLNRLIDVIHATDMTTREVIQSEIAMIKIQCEPKQRPEILQTSIAFKSKAIDITDSSITFQISGSSEKIDSAVKIFKPYGLIETVRSGNILIKRGSTLT